MNNLKEYIIEKFKISKDIKDVSAEYEKKKDKPELWEVGDIIYTHWGYNMVIIDYYEVIKKTTRGFVVKKLKEKIVSGDGQRGKSEPILKKYTEDNEIRCRINKYGSLKIDDAYAYLWDGQPKDFDHMD